MLIVIHLRPNCINMHPALLLSAVPFGKRTKASITTNVRRKIMKRKMTGAAGLAAAFVAGMVVATALGAGLSGGMASAGAKTRGAAVQGQQVTLQQVITPTVSDEDIALLRRDIRAMKTQVIGQNMSLSDPEANKFWPIYKHY